MFNAFIGLAGIFDYKIFGMLLKPTHSYQREKYKLINGLEALIHEPTFTTVKDLHGLILALRKLFRTRRYFKDNFITKSNEFLYKEKNKLLSVF